MTEQIFREKAETELLELLRKRRGLDLTISCNGDNWTVTTEVGNPFRSTFQGSGRSFAEAWVTQGLPEKGVPIPRRK